MVGVLTFFIQVSLLLFCLGLALFLYQIAPLSCGVITSIPGVGVLQLPLYPSSSPLPHSIRLSRAIGALYRRIFSVLCPSITEFSSDRLDTSTTLPLQSLRRWFHACWECFDPFKRAILSRHFPIFQKIPPSSMCQLQHFNGCVIMPPIRITVKSFTGQCGEQWGQQLSGATTDLNTAMAPTPKPVSTILEMLPAYKLAGPIHGAFSL